MPSLISARRMLAINMPQLLPANSYVVFAGDSITANGFNISVPTTYGQPDIGFSVYTNVFMNGAMRLDSGSNAGVAGNTSTQLLSRYNTDVIAKLPAIVVILIGTNDLGSVSYTTTLSNIDTMIALNRSIGARTILLKILPRGSDAGHGNNPMTGSTLTNWISANAGIASRNARDVYVVDCEPLVGNMDASHTANTAYFYDTPPLHPNAVGANIIGSKVASIIRTVMSATNSLLTVNNSAANYVSNGFMTGTAGVKSGGATGSAADGWSLAAGSSGGATVVGSKVARDDGFSEWQQVTISGNYTGNSKTVIFQRNDPNLSGLNSSNKVRIQAEVQVDAGLQNIAGISLTCSPTASQAMTVASGSASTASYWPSDGPWSGVLRSLEFNLDTTGTNGAILYCNMQLKNNAASSPCAAVVRWGRAEIVKLS